MSPKTSYNGVINLTMITYISFILPWWFKLVMKNVTMNRISTTKIKIGDKPLKKKEVTSINNNIKKAVLLWPG